MPKPLQRLSVFQLQCQSNQLLINTENKSTLALEQPIIEFNTQMNKLLSQDRYQQVRIKSASSKVPYQCILSRNHLEITTKSHQKKIIVDMDFISRSIQVNHVSITKEKNLKFRRLHLVG